MKCALYHRVSTTDQNPDLARQELREAAFARGMEVVLDVEETGSGARKDRPGWQRVLEAARKGKVGAVLVWKLDRAGRSALDLLANISALNDAGCRFIAVTQGIDAKPDGDPMSKLVLTMLAAIAEFERDLIRERTRLGLAGARARGSKLGRPKVAGPAKEDVHAIRAQGKGWKKVARELGCTIAMARRRAAGGYEQEA